MEISGSLVDFNEEFKHFHEETAKFMNEIEQEKVKVHYPMVI